MYRNLAYGRKTDSLNIVLIDGNHGMRSILTTILKSNGITGIRAHGNANRAMSDMLERVPDAVLIQWVLPDSDAETMIRTLRTEAMRPLCFAPVIVLSANVSPMLRESTRAGG